MQTNTMTDNSYQPLLLATTDVDWIKAALMGVLFPIAIVLGIGMEWAFGYVVVAAAIYIFVLREETPAAYLLMIEALMIIGWFATLLVISIVGAMMAAI